MAGRRSGRSCFFSPLARCGSVKSAAALAGCSRESVYRLKRRPDARAFSRAWDAALLHARDLYADELLERGLNGWTETVWHNGEEAGEREKWSAPLFLAALERLDGAAEELDRRDNPARAAASQFDELTERIGAGDDCDDLLFAQDMAVQLASEADEFPEITSEELMARLEHCNAVDEIMRTPPEEVDISDLDEAEMDGWDILQWTRAEQSGFLDRIGFYDRDPEGRDGDGMNGGLNRGLNGKGG